jgi:hypothetical protein
MKGSVCASRRFFFDNKSGLLQNKGHLLHKKKRLFYVHSEKLK